MRLRPPIIARPSAGFVQADQDYKAIIDRGGYPVPVSARQRLEPYLRRLYGYAFSLTHDDDAAREVLHDAVVKALAAKSLPCDEPAYRAWLFRILRNACIDRHRRSATREATLAVEERPEDIDWRYGSETQQVNALAVRLAFRQLSLVHREIIGAIDISGLTYAEAAEVFGLPVGTVMSRISRARAALYKAMQETTADETIEFLPARQQAKARGKRG